jgi:hypothetical protein
VRDEPYILERLIKSGKKIHISKGHPFLKFGDALNAKEQLNLVNVVSYIKLSFV